MIAKLKQHAIERMVEDKRPGSRAKRKYYTAVNSRGNTPLQDSGVDDDSDGSDEKDTAPLMRDNDDDDDDKYDDNGITESGEMREHMFKHMTYGDIGQLCFGKFGVGLVNFCIALTQFGFCVGYCIFIGNTIQYLFPKLSCYNLNHTEVCSPYKAPEVSSHIKRSVNNTDLINMTLPSTVLPMFSELSTQNYRDINTTVSPNYTTTPPSNWSSLNPSVIPVTEKSTSPDLRILVASPVPLFVFFALIRSVRYLGFISMLANASILVGLVALIGFLISGKTCFLYNTV